MRKAETNEGTSQKTRPLWEGEGGSAGAAGGASAAASSSVGKGRGSPGLYPGYRSSFHSETWSSCGGGGGGGQACPWVGFAGIKGRADAARVKIF